MVGPSPGILTRRSCLCGVNSWEKGETHCGQLQTAVECEHAAAGVGAPAFFVRRSLSVKDLYTSI